MWMFPTSTVAGVGFGVGYFAPLTGDVNPPAPLTCLWHVQWTERVPVSWSLVHFFSGKSWRFVESTNCWPMAYFFGRVFPFLLTQHIVLQFSIINHYLFCCWYSISQQHIINAQGVLLDILSVWKVTYSNSGNFGRCLYFGVWWFSSTTYRK